MTLIKSLLLGSAATLVVVAAAQAADLPTKKGAPVAQYVKICNIGGVAGFVIPGSDTCLKISGTLYAMGEVGNLNQQYAWAGTTLVTSSKGSSESSLVKGADTNTRDDLGYYTRFNFALDAANNTAYGVLTAHIDINFNIGSGFNSPGGAGPEENSVNINHAYLQWAGFTAGVHDSYFSFFGGGEGWENTMSPDRKGYNQPNLFAYTATFGGGFSATISLQDPKLSGPSAGATIAGSDEFIAGNSIVEGMRSPDIVGSIDLAQGWGTAHLAGVAHNVRMINADYQSLNTWGWAIDGGLKFNLPTLGAGDNIQLQGVWSRNAVWYSGVSDGMWGEGGATNGNGISMPIGDSFSNYNGSWATPTAWSLTAISEFHLGPTFSIDPEISYLQLTWSGLSAGQLSPNSESWIGGAVFHWDPVAHLDFNIELLYQSTHQATPDGFITPVAAGNSPWQSNTSGLEGRFEITRDF